MIPQNFHHRSLRCYRKLTFVLLLGYSAAPTSGTAQNVPEDVIEQTAERAAETTTREIDLSDQADELEYLRSHPVNLNNTTFDELNRLSFLDERQLNNLYLYIQAYGTLYSTAEFKAIEGFDSVTLQKILPYVTIGPPPPKHPVRLKELFSYGRSELILKYQQVLQKQKGYRHDESGTAENPDAVYPGSPQKYSFRYKYSYFDRLGLGISGEKDPGEEFFRGSQKAGMDFYGGYLSLMNTGFLKQVVVGNFRAGFGQGLVLGTGLSMVAAPGTGSLRRASGGIRPSLSVSETGYLRGAAATICLKSFELSAFYSGHTIDGNPTGIDTVSGEMITVSSIYGSGYHRLPREIQNKNIIRERICGGNLNFRSNIFSIGATAFYSHWSASLVPRSYPYNRFSFRGNENLNIGADFQLALRNIFFFGELGRSMNGGLAWLIGGQFTPDPRLAFTLLYRNYQRNYQDLLSNAIGQNSTNANEAGIIFTFNARLFPGFILSGHADLFRFPWLKYQVDFATQGSEYQLLAEYAAGRELLMLLRFRMKTKEANIPGTDEPISRMGEGRTTDLRFQLNWSINTSLQVKNRLEILESRREVAYKHYGYLVSQALQFRPVVKPFSLAVLYALFDTDSYSERIYTYENDVLYGYSVPSFYGKGIRFSLLTEWSPARWLTFWVRFSDTFYSDRNVIGTGLEEINGNNKSDLTVQCRFRF